ncbi:MAG TPA: protoheme IX farnesyltransferase [Bacteroidales bacterium]|nr:protoheme IX farnesyltransferase [Bacteroidales bacterium]
MAQSLKKINAFLKLIRLRLSLLVTFSALTGYLFTGHPEVFSLFVLATGVFLLAAGSSALNQYQERQLDAMMERTRSRPIPLGLVQVWEALLIAISIIISGVLILWQLQTTTMLLGLLNILLYNGLYTPLKTKTPLSILPGALVGAIPPLMGWSVSGESLIHPHILFLASFMFLWQIPHFWLLMIMYGKDYERAGFSTISSHFKPTSLKIIVFAWASTTSIFLLSFSLFGLMMPLMLILFLFGINLLFILLFYRFLFGRPENILSAFITINSFMAIVLLLFVVIGFL